MKQITIAILTFMICLLAIGCVTTPSVPQTETKDTAPNEDVVTYPFSEGEHAFAYVYKYTDPYAGTDRYDVEVEPRETLEDHTVLDHVLYGPADASFNDEVYQKGWDFVDVILVSANGSTYVYTPKTRTATECFLPENADVRYVIFDVATHLPTVLALRNSDSKFAIYSFAVNTMISEYIYDGFCDGAVDGRLLMYIKNDDGVSSEEDLPRVTNYLISLADGELLATHTEQHRGYRMFLVTSPDGKTAYYQSYYAYGSGLYEEGQLYTAGIVPFGPDDATYPCVAENGELYCTVGNTILRFAPNGAELEAPESPYLEKILQIFHNCIVSVGSDGFVHVADLDGNLIKTICEWTDDMRYHRFGSGWKPKTELYEAGLYLYFGNGRDGIEYGYIPTQEELFYEVIPDGFAYAKPILYLYPEKECEASVSLLHDDRITVSYPKYPDDGWSVTAKPDGTLTDGERTYYCLYWEEDCVYDAAFDEGFCVAGKDSAAFLEDTLAKLGLTEREANECIVYWLPILESNPYNVIYFECTEEREAKSPLLITPTPDTLIRVALHIRPTDTFVSLPAQDLTAPERAGFVAVEWGGVLYTN